MLVDTHCHLSSKKFSEDLDDVIEQAKLSGVEKILIPTLNLNDLQNVEEITNKHEGVYGLGGLYPGEAQKNHNWKSEVNEIKKIITGNKKIIGIGEIGMDGYWNERNLTLEKAVFRAQLEMAVEINVPVVIHSRNAESEITHVMNNLDILPRGHFHCWSGDEAFLQYVLSKDFYVGFCGNITYPSSESLREMAKIVPIEKMLLETDSPYLPPQGMRGERNQPKNVKILGDFLAELKNVDSATLISQTGANARKLYKL